MGLLLDKIYAFQEKDIFPDVANILMIGKEETLELKTKYSSVVSHVSPCGNPVNILSLFVIGGVNYLIINIQIDSFFAIYKKVFSEDNNGELVCAYDNFRK